MVGMSFNTTDHAIFPLSHMLRNTEMPKIRTNSLVFARKIKGMIIYTIENKSVLKLKLDSL